MNDVTNKSSTLLQPRKLELAEEGDSVAKLTRSGDTYTSSVKKRKEELELRNKVTRLEKKLQDVRLGRSTVTTITTASVTTVQTCDERHSYEVNLELITTPTHEERTTTLKQTNGLLKSQQVKRFWESLYAIIAILELLTCQGLYDVRMDSAPIELVPHATISSSASMYHAPRCKEILPMMRTKPFGVTDSHRYWGQNVHDVITNSLESLDWARQVYTTFRSMTWQEYINKAFMIAIIIHTIVQSWAIAASRNNEKRQREQQDALASATKVTRRSKRRFKKLETSSSNRHFIMRWTSNRIRWSKRTTEILGASCIILLLRLLFLPIIKRNKVVTIIQSNSRDGISLPFISPIYTPKETLEMTIEIAGRTLSLVESVMMDILSWIHSIAVSHFRRKVKEYAIHFVTLALMRPWEASARIQNIFTVIRWAKFVAPLVGTCNKLRGQVADYKKKRILRKRYERANFLWSNLFKTLRMKATADRAVRRLQQNFRNRRLRIQSQRIIETQEGSRVEAAVIRFQRRYRERAAESRLRVRRAKTRLSDIGIGQQIISFQQRELADSLRREIRERSRKSRRLLLRPNTLFSLAWKRMTITCVLIEVSYKLLGPIMASKSGQHLSLDEFVVHLLTPTANRLASRSPLEGSYIFIEFISMRISEIVSMCSFLDVFITFFTGDIDEKTGLLVPRPFFARWILPGVVLQLIVNPTMKDISRVVKRALAFSNNVGFMRVLHVTFAIFPVIRAVTLCVIDFLFNFVDSENQNLLLA